MLDVSRQRWRRAVGVGAAVAVLGFVATLVPLVLELDETLGLGFLFGLRGPVSPPDSVVIIGISERSAKALRQSSNLIEWRRTLYADLVDALEAASAQSIVFDLSFARQRDDVDDRRLVQAVRGAGNVVLLEWSTVESRGDGKPSDVVDLDNVRTPPFDDLAASALATAPFTLPLVPVQVTQFWTFGRLGAPSLPVAALQAHLLPDYEALRSLLVAAVPSLAAKLAATRAELIDSGSMKDAMIAIRDALWADPSLHERLRERLRVANLEPALARRLAGLIDVYGGPSALYLNYYGPAHTIRTIPFESALAHPGSLDVAGKTVFVGYSEPRQPPDQKDFFHSVFSERTGISLSGVEIGATAFANLLEHRSLVPVGRLPHLLIVLLWGLALGTLLNALTMSRAIGLAAIGVVVWSAVAYWLFAKQALWLPLLVPVGIEVPVALAVAIFANYRELARQRQRIEVALGYYVPRSEVRRLANAAAAVRADNRLLHGTCLYTDAEQYTTVAESLHPEALAELMNDYYRVMFEVVARHGGFVSDTAGDSMVAVWASAEPSRDSGARACAAALEILDVVDEFNRHRDRHELPTRVGLASGEMLIGSFGGEQRLEYRAIGDIVNTASRIQGLNRLLGTLVLVSESSFDESTSDVFVRRRDVGTFLLRGKTRPVRLYELLRDGAGDEYRRHLVEGFDAALAEFRAGSWSSAQRAFAALADRFPGDGPSRYYAVLSADFVRRPPQYWDGAIRVEVK